MDNLTHSLIGAALGQAGLKRKTGLAMPALIVGANLPDIDAGCVVYGIESLAMRRGLTHGPIALVVLPLLLAGALWWFDGWQDRRGTRPQGRLPVRFGWLLALSFIACLTHPLFDWFNNYGIRLLEPFSSAWFYGDTLFIVDPWIIAMLGAGVWFSLRKERVREPNWRRPARWALCSLVPYIGMNMTISGLAVLHHDEPSFAVANAIPGAFWKREVVWRDDGSMRKVKPPERYGRWEFSALDGLRSDEREFGPTNMTDSRIAAWSKDDPAAQAFLFWSRMPVAELHPDRIILRDQRFMDPRIGDRFSVTLGPPK
jgi:inner membrane protein